MFKKQFDKRVLRLLAAALVGMIIVVSAIGMVAAQQPSDIYLNREPVEVYPGQIEHIDWTITFTNTPISYSFSIYDTENEQVFFNEYPAVGEASPIRGAFDWPVPDLAVYGPYKAEILFYTRQISRPFDSQAAITFLVVAPPTPTPIPTPTPTEPCLGNLAVYQCEDKNANGVCKEPKIDRPLPGVELCLSPAPEGQPACQTAGDDGYARWENLACGAYEVTEQLTGLFRGYYPSSPMTQPVSVEKNQTTEITFSIVFPLYPRGVAVNPANNKVYAVFQGIKELDGTRPYPFMAVVDSETDRVIATVPAIGREPFGVAVANNKVYVAAYGQGEVTVVDSETDEIIKRIGGFANPTRLAVDAAQNRVYVVDAGAGQVRVIDAASDTIVHQFTVAGADATDAYDVAFGNDVAYATLRKAPANNAFMLKAVQPPDQQTAIPFVYQNQTGSPYAIAARAEEADTYLYLTYAPEPRGAQLPYQWPGDSTGQPLNNPVNPNHLSVVEIPNGDPAVAQRLAVEVELGNFAETGLAFNAATQHLLGTYSGGFYEPLYPDHLACALIPKARDQSGSAYVLSAADPRNPYLIGKPTPGLRVGNSTIPMTGDFWWRSPFDVAVNPNNNKVYVTDRCWHDYDNQYDNLFPDHELWHSGGGAIFVFNDDLSNPHPPPPTATPSANQSSVVEGRVMLQGRSGSQSATITLDDGEPISLPVAADGSFKFDEAPTGVDLSLAADAPGFVPAVCAGLRVSQAETNLDSVTLLSGDFNDDDTVDILDLTVMGSDFGKTGANILTDINRDGLVDIYDLILVSKNFGETTQAWLCGG